jgi:hypothetical protein
MRGSLPILLFFSFTAAVAQPVSAPLQSFISGGAATGAVHPSTNVPTHFSSFGQPMFMPRALSNQVGAGTSAAVDLMFTLAVHDFSPVTGDVGSTLTINGVGFSETPLKNVVRFGATRATVTAATRQTLTVTVPPGATYSPISVTVDGLVAHSTLPHSVTFDNDDAMSDLFSPGQALVTIAGADPLDLEIIDVDGDGSAEMCLTAYTSGFSTLWVSPVTYNGEIFSGGTVQSAGSVPGHDTGFANLSCGDMDGDGKSDFVLNNEQGTSIWIIRNTSEPGTISFDAPVEIPVGVNAGPTTIMDVDLDGKLDVVIRFSTTIMILKGRGEPGFISFYPAVEVSPAPTASGVTAAAADFDKDGKPDIVSLRSTGDAAVTLHKNETVLGSIGPTSLTLETDLVLSGVPAALTFWPPPVGDLDMDGRLDIVAKAGSPESAWVIRNVSTPGVLNTSSFEVGFTLGSLSGVTQYAIGDLNGDGRPEVVSNSYNGWSIFTNGSSPGSLAPTDFPDQVDSEPFSGRSIAIADLNGDSRPELVVTDHDIGGVLVFHNIGDNVAPGIDVLSPIDDAVDVLITADLSITFNEPIQPAIGSIEIKRQADNGVEATMVVGTARVDITGNTMTLYPPSNLPPNTAFYVLVPAGAVKDLVGNDFGGISDVTTWNFTTGPDTEPPVVTIQFPTVADGGVPVDVDLILTFDEPIEKNTGDILIHRLDNGSLLKTINVATPDVIVSGLSLTIQHSELPPNTDVYVIIPNSAVRDLFGNFFAGYSDDTGWNFTTGEDESGPGVVSLSPADEDTVVPTNASLVMTFDEPIARGSGDILVMNGVQEVQRFTNPHADLSIVGNQLTMLSPDPGFWPANATLHVIIPAGAIEDAYANDFIGYSDDTGWRFHTGDGVDTSPPVIAIDGLSPANNATSVAVNTTLIVTFDESVLPGTSGSIRIFRYDNDFELFTFGVADPEVVVEDNTLTVTPGSLPQDTKLYVLLDDAIVKNLGQLSFDGTMTKDTWSFTTVPLPPSLEGVSPANGQVDVAVNATLGLEFDESITAGIGNIYIRRMSDGGQVYRIPVNDPTVVISGTSISISQEGLPPGITLYVTIDAGAIKDMQGNDFVGLSSSSAWNFTTAGTPDTAGPTLSDKTPDDDAIDVSISGTLVLTFNENVAPGSGNIIISRVSGGAEELSIDIQSSMVSFDGLDAIISHDILPADTELSVTLGNGVITDLSGNVFGGIADPAWTFTTAGDTDPPGLTSRTPSHNMSGVLVNANLVLFFDEPIKTGSGVITIFTQANSNVVDFIGLDKVGITSGTVATINSDNNLPYNTPVYVSIPPGVFRDMSDNDFAGFVEGQWNFTTELDLTGPLLGPNTTDSPVAAQQTARIRVVLTEPESQVRSTNSFSYRTLGTTVSPTIGELTLSAGVWQGNTDPLFMKEGGIEYWIHAFNTSHTEQVHGPFIIRLNVQDEGLVIPYSTFGRKQENYRVVAVPLDLAKKSVNDVFADDLGPQKDRKWRVAHYANGTTEQDYEGDIVPGEGYWLIVEKDPGKPIDSGPGTTIGGITSNVGAEKTITLRANDWVQIGNPYNFNISWSDVENANGGLPIDFKVFRSGTPTSATSLSAMEGGFVFSTAAGELRVPPKKTSGRVGEVPQLHNPINNSDWEVLLNLEHGELHNVTSGLGMRTDASSGFDKHDGMTLPRFYDYLELNHNGSIGKYHYSLDVVPTSESHIWEFSVESSLKDGRLSFSWDNTYLGENNKELVLFDVTNQKPVDMKLNTGYQFDRSSTNQFKVVFGDRYFVEENTHVNRVVIHQVYPNPAGSEVNVSVGLPSDAWTSVELHDLLGRKVATIYEGELARGNHNINTKRADGEETGLYLIVVRAAGQLATTRVILK